MKNNFNIGFITTPLSIALVALQSNQLFQIIQIILTCITLLITAVYSLWKWYKEASKDKKLDAEELKKLGNIVDNLNNDINKIESSIEESKK